MVFQKETLFVHPEFATVEADAFQEVTANPGLCGFPSVSLGGYGSGDWVDSPAFSVFIHSLDSGASGQRGPTPQGEPCSDQANQRLAIPRPRFDLAAARIWSALYRSPSRQ